MLSSKRVVVNQWCEPVVYSCLTLFYPDVQAKPGETGLLSPVKRDEAVPLLVHRHLSIFYNLVVYCSLMRVRISLASGPIISGLYSRLSD